MALVGYSGGESTGQGSYGSAPDPGASGGGGRVIFGSWFEPKAGPVFLGAGSSSSPGGATGGSATPDDSEDTSADLATGRGRHGRKADRGGRGRPGGRARGDGGSLSPVGRAVAGLVVGAVVGKAFDLPGGWLLGGLAGGAVGYWGGDLWDR